MIPVFEPNITKEDVWAVTDAAQKGQISGTFGHYITDFEEQFAEYCGVKYGVAVNSGTSALQLAVSVCDFEPGSEVLVSASTNIATALAPFHNGLKVMPVDSETITWNINTSKIEACISDRTKAIIPVHLFGHPADMHSIRIIADKFDLKIIEDAAEAHGSRIEHRKCGSFGDMACFSFYANKTITSGEGGMVVTNDSCLAEELRLRRNLAFTRPRFYHEKAGFNFRMTGMQAALGLSQLRRIDQIINRKREIASIYNGLLNEVEGIQLPVELPDYFNTYWMYAIRFNAPQQIGEKIQNHLHSRGIDTRSFFYSISKQPFLIKSLQMIENDCPVAENFFKEGIYLPCSLNITKSEISKVVNEIKNAIIK